MPNDAPLDELKAELDNLAAENLALQVVVQFLFKSLGDANPALRPLLLKTFDDAANFTGRMRPNDDAVNFTERMRANLTRNGELWT